MLRDGQYIGAKPIGELSRPELIKMMVGREMTNLSPTKDTGCGDVLLEVKNLNNGSKVKDISFQLHRGEILGFAGIVGAGRTETMRSIFGLDPCESGEIYLEGQKIKVRCVRDASRRLTVKASSLSTMANFLSGGNQQKLILCKWLLMNPKVLILDEPTRGIDIGAKWEIYNIIIELAKQGVGIIPCLVRNWFAANRPDVEIFEVNYVECNEATLAQSIFEDWIQKYGVGGFDGVATQSSMQTQGIVESMKAIGLDATNFTLGGIFASSSDWIKEGTEYCDLYQDPDLEATTVLDMMRHMVDGTTNELEFLDGAPTKNFVNVPMTTLNADNADEYTSDALAAK